jgi:FAD/FMN-containing dehydrogenase
MSGNALSSWGRYPAFPQQGHPIFWRENVPEALADKAAGSSVLAYGCGRSYGDSCMAVSNNVLAMCGMNRLIAADWHAGVIVAEAGLTLAELIGIALPRGWFLNVTPGTKFVTLGGAVANDVHGKNHHVAGTFGRHVRSLSLHRSTEGTVTASREERPDCGRCFPAMSNNAAFGSAVSMNFSICRMFTIENTNIPLHGSIAWQPARKAGADIM